MKEDIEILEIIDNSLANKFRGQCVFGVEHLSTIKKYIEKQQTKINALQMEHDYDVKMIDEVKGEAVKLYKEINKLKRQIEIKDQYLSLIYGIGFDYDGWDTVESLKSLIDDLVDYAKKAVKNDDKYAVYQGGNGRYFNILHEEVEKESKNGT